MTNDENFWLWFLEHKPDFDALYETQNPFWDEALGRLKTINEKLWFEVSKPSTDGSEREFIVTAEGHVDLFPLVDELVAHAPPVPGWRFISLKPAMGFDFITHYEGIKFEPRSMWFLPLKNKVHPEDLGLRIGVPNFSPEIERQASNAVLVILDSALGERAAAIDIDYVVVGALPDDPASKGFIELPELPKYIEWWKRKSQASR